MASTHTTEGHRGRTPAPAERLVFLPYSALVVYWAEEDARPKAPHATRSARAEAGNWAAKELKLETKPKLKLMSEPKLKRSLSHAKAWP